MELSQSVPKDGRFSTVFCDQVLKEKEQSQSVPKDGRFSTYRRLAAAVDAA